MRTTLDLRGYKSLRAERRLVLAGRVQAGAVFGASLLGTPRDYLFYSGGGGTVRGQPYQSLGVDLRKIYGDKIKDVRPTVQATKASVENLVLLQQGKGEIAFTLGDSLDAAWKGAQHLRDEVARIDAYLKT